MKSWSWLLMVAAAIAAFGSGSVAGAAENPRHTIYVTVGDNQWIVNWGEPLDSKATVEAAFDSYRHSMYADRVFWRGEQDQQWLDTFIFRSEPRLVYGWWQWVKYLDEKVGTNRIAVAAAHRNGMEIWNITGLFDYGSPATAGGCGNLPYVCEHRLRAQHPEFAPVNRYGTRVQGGPMEFCYPEVRKVLVRQLTDHVVKPGYDGLALYTYVENMTQRYLDEFGFNEPIVKEFKRRYGVDLRTQTFDKDAWARLRGEYLTRFLRELKQSLARNGKKLAVYLNPENTHLPAIWNTSYGKIITAGRIHIDWERWVKEGIVDELVIGPFGGSQVDKTLSEVLAVCRGTKTKVTQFKSKGDMAEPDATRLIFCSQGEIECGFDWFANADWGPPLEKTMDQPLGNLKSEDRYARRRVLWRLGKKAQKGSVEEILPSTRDRDVFCRLLAVRALGATQDSKAIPAIEEALLDSENAVRIEAALALGENPGPDSLARVLEAVWKDNSTWQFNHVAVPMVVKKLREAGKVGPSFVQMLIARLSDPKPGNRQMAIVLLQASANATIPQAQEPLKRALVADPDAYTRELALEAFSDNGTTPEVLSALIGGLRDKVENVQIVAARLLAARGANADSLPQLKSEAFESLTSLFRSFGDGCKRTDKDWGWRDVGNGLLRFGKEGEKTLTELMAQRKDRRLAELAWQVLHVRQLSDGFVEVTEQQDKEAHAARPVW